MQFLWATTTTILLAVAVQMFTFPKGKFFFLCYIDRISTNKTMIDVLSLISDHFAVLISGIHCFKRILITAKK